MSCQASSHDRAKSRLRLLLGTRTSAPALAAAALSSIGLFASSRLIIGDELVTDDRNGIAVLDTSTDSGHAPTASDDGEGIDNGRDRTDDPNHTRRTREELARVRQCGSGAEACRAGPFC